MFLINDEIYVIRKLPLIGPVYTPLKGVLTRFLSEGAHIYRKKKRAWKQAVTAMIKIRFVFNGYESS